MSMSETPGEIRRRRPWQTRSSDPLWQHRAVTGLDAQVRWYERVRSFLLLCLMLITLGVAFAGAVALMFFAGSILLEVLAG